MILNYIIAVWICLTIAIILFFVARRILIKKEPAWELMLAMEKARHKENYKNDQ